MLDEILARIASQDAAGKKELVKAAWTLSGGKMFIPSPGPQFDAYISPADVLLFGGNPGGGKSALEIGLALNEHYRSLIVRKNFSDLEGLIDNAKKIAGTSEGFIGGARPKYRKEDGGVIHFAGLSADGGIGGLQGVDHDLICVDEAATVPEKQVRLLMGWMRTERPGQRCRMVLASNPPLDSTGDWMIDYFGPWINSNHPNPAKPGELRYYLPGPDGKDIECEKDDWSEIESVRVFAQSRTYIPSKFTDNPFYNPEEYAKSLAGLPEEVRNILVSGNFMMARQDQAFQVIPTDWVRQAQARWKNTPYPGIPMCAMGVDVARGGKDDTVLAPRYDGWYAPLTVVPGRETPDGKTVAGLVVTHRRDQCQVIIDMGGGYGGAPFEHLQTNIGHQFVHGHVGSSSAVGRTNDGSLSFYNKRSQIWWQFREALDPSQPGGSFISLPDDPEMVADLTAPTFQVVGGKIKIESKGEGPEGTPGIIKRLGRSPGRGDAVVMAWSEGNRALATHATWNVPAHRVAPSIRQAGYKINDKYQHRRR